MRNVLVNIYNARVQPYIAELSKAHTKWHELIAKIFLGLSVGPLDGPLSDYYNESLTQKPSSIYGQFKKASVAHAKAWTKLLEQCGLRPGNAQT